MARIRTVKPEYWADEKIGQLSRDARLLFIATWNLADDEGRLRWTPAFIRAQVFPYDDLTTQGVRAIMAELDGSAALTEDSVSTQSRIKPYIANGERYAVIVNFKDHQVINRPTPSKLPNPDGEPAPKVEEPQVKAENVPPVPTQTPATHGDLSEDSRMEKEVEREKEVEGDLFGAHSAAPAPPAAAPKNVRGTRLTEDWTPDDGLREWAAATVAHVDIDRETDKFRDYWLSKAGRDACKTDWRRTWQNWMRTAAERAPSPRLKVVGDTFNERRSQARARYGIS